MDREQYAALLYSTFVALRFVLGNAHPDERSRDTAYDATDGAASERSHDWTGCDEGPQPRNCQRADAGQPAEDAADSRAGRASGRRALRRLGIFLVSEILRSRVLRKEHGNIGVAESCVA